MQPEVADRLVELNHRFYQSFAGPFSESRLRLQPGVVRILEKIPNETSVLDLGCGGGTLAAFLIERGFRGAYLGLDFSPGLLENARESVASAYRHSEMPASPAARFEFKQADLAGPAWEDGLPREKFEYILAFATLHHIPGAELRLRLLSQIRRHISDDGRFIHSNWQFLNSERLRGRILPWELAGLSPDDVDPGDALLDWRRGGEGQRYAHHFLPEELQSLADQSGFTIEAQFFSDGREGNLGLYQVWALPQDSD
ncbi:MAG: class I SAM-dependent methyltransferase [Anaerolineales bacterium]|nr:class I SAM-dependent methyltransferase [Anaerolineales bacterium]